MTDAVKEQLIRTAFKYNWLAVDIAVGFFIFAFAFITESTLPKYFKRYLLICVTLISLFVISWVFFGNVYLGALIFRVCLVVLFLLMIKALSSKCSKIDEQLEFVTIKINSDGDVVAAWNKLQKISVEELTPWQKEKYDKHRSYLQKRLDNMNDTERRSGHSCDKQEEDNFE